MQKTPVFSVHKKYTVQRPQFPLEFLFNEKIIKHEQYLF